MSEDTKTVWGAVLVWVVFQVLVYAATAWINAPVECSGQCEKDARITMVMIGVMFGWVPVVGFLSIREDMKERRPVPRPQPRWSDTNPEDQ